VSQEEAGGDKKQAGIIKDCFRKWMETHEKALGAGPLAYDGQHNVYATKILNDDPKEDEFFEIELAPNPGRRRPRYFMCEFTITHRHLLTGSKSYIVCAPWLAV
jgi:hypothetical protein